MGDDFDDTVEEVAEAVEQILEDLGLGLADRMDADGNCGGWGEACAHPTLMAYSTKESELKLAEKAYQDFWSALKTATVKRNLGRQPDAWEVPALHLRSKGSQLRWVRGAVGRNEKGKAVLRHEHESLRDQFRKPPTEGHDHSGHDHAPAARPASA